MHCDDSILGIECFRSSNVCVSTVLARNFVKLKTINVRMFECLYADCRCMLLKKKLNAFRRQFFSFPMCECEYEVRTCKNQTNQNAATRVASAVTHILKSATKFLDSFFSLDFILRSAYVPAHHSRQQITIYLFILFCFVLCSGSVVVSRICHCCQFR